MDFTNLGHSHLTRILRVFCLLVRTFFFSQYYTQALFLNGRNIPRSHSYRSAESATKPFIGKQPTGTISMLNKFTLLYINIYRFQVHIYTYGFMIILQLIPMHFVSMWCFQFRSWYTIVMVPPYCELIRDSILSRVQSRALCLKSFGYAVSGNTCAQRFRGTLRIFDFIHEAYVHCWASRDRARPCILVSYQT